MKETPETELKQEMDGWIKSLRQDILVHASDLDRLQSSVLSSRNELSVHYEAITQLESRMVNLEVMFERVLGLLDHEQKRRVGSCVQRLKSR